MSDREKKLAVIVAALALFGVVYLGWGFVDRQITKRTNEISRLDREIKDKEFEFEKGRRAAKKIAVYERKSLPGDVQVARSDYRAWLDSELHKAGIQGTRITHRPGSMRKGPYQDITHTVDAKGNLLQVIDFLHRFYSVDDLHLIQSLQLDPDRENDKLLSIRMTIDGAVVKGAKPDKEVGRPADDVPDAKLYIDSIGQRNVFSPANLPPKLARIGDQRAKLDERFSLSLKASDDDDDNLAFEMVEGPSGASISESGRFSYRPEELEEVSVTVRVYDDGIPSKSDTQEFKLAVYDPPPEEPVVDRTPSFDDAEHTVVVSTFQVGEKREVWLHVRTTGEMMKLREGDDFKVGSVEAIVERVGNGDVEFRTDDGNLLVEIGDKLTQAEQVAKGI